MSTAPHASALKATSDYYGQSSTTRALRLALTTTQLVWPALAVRVAYRLFGTPFPPRWLRRQREWPELRLAPVETGWGAAHATSPWKHESWAFENSGVTLHSPASAPHADVVLLVHGWGGHSQQMLPLAQAVADAGFRPVLLDLPAHGDSAGSVSNLPQFARAIEYASARLLQQGHTLRAVVAHSLAANALAYSASRGLDAQRIVLLAPPASPYEYTRMFAHAFGLSENTRSGMQRRIESREGILMPQFEPAAVGPRIAMPTLIAHDRNDRVNRFADGEAYAGAIRSARLVASEGLGHRRILSDENTLHEVTRFIVS